MVRRRLACGSGRRSCWRCFLSNRRRRKLNQQRQRTGQMRRRHSNLGASRTLLLLQSVSLVTITTLALGGCESMGLSEPSVPGLSSVTSMFDKKQEKLPGRRISVLKADEKGAISAGEATGP